MNSTDLFLPEHLSRSLEFELKRSQSDFNRKDGFPGLLEHHDGENIKAFPFHRFFRIIKYLLYDLKICVQ